MSVGGRFVLACLATGVLALRPARADDSTPLTLGLGAQKTIAVPGVARIQILDPSVADVKVVGTQQILVLARKEGRTTLLVWKSSGQRLTYLISIKRQDPNEVMAEIRKLLGEMEGVSVRMVGDRIYLDGHAYTSADADRIEEILGLYPSVKSFVKIAPNTKRLVAQNLNANFGVA